MPRPQMSLDMMLYEDPRAMQSVMVSPAEEALLRARDVELRDRPVEGNIANPLELLAAGFAPKMRIPFRLPGERAMSPAGTALAESMAPKATSSVATVPSRKAINDMADQELEGLLRTLERKSAGPMDPAPPDPLRDMPELAAYRAKADKMPMYDAPPVEMRVGAPGGPAPEEPDLVRMAEVRSLMRKRMLAKERAGTVPEGGKTTPALIEQPEGSITNLDLESPLGRSTAPLFEGQTYPARTPNAIGKPARITPNGFYYDEAAIPTSQGKRVGIEDQMDGRWRALGPEYTAEAVSPRSRMDRLIAEQVARAKKGR